MDVFLENAQQLFDVARSDDNAEPNDFALLIRPDGGLHFVMESPLSLEAAAIHGGARTAYRVTKSAGGEIRVTGRDGNRECVLLQRAPEPASPRVSRLFRTELLRDQPLYRISLAAHALPGILTRGRMLHWRMSHWRMLHWRMLHWRMLRAGASPSTTSCTATSYATT